MRKENRKKEKGMETMRNGEKEEIGTKVGGLISERGGCDERRGINKYTHIHIPT